MTKEIPQEQFPIIANKLRGAAKVTYEFFDGFTPPEGWTQVGKLPTEPYKVKAINEELGLFAKVFAPVAEGYAGKLAQTMIQLGALPIAKPILAPLLIDGGVLFFELGKFRSKGRLKDILLADDADQISGIIKANGLIPLGPYDIIEIMEVGQRECLVDLVDDSNAGIGRFIGDL